MLSLTVKTGDYITIGPDIVIKFFKSGDANVVGIEAPRELRISRAKLYEQENETPACIQRVQAQEKKKPGFKRGGPDGGQRG